MSGIAMLKLAKLSALQVSRGIATYESKTASLLQQANVSVAAKKAIGRLLLIAWPGSVAISAFFPFCGLSPLFIKSGQATLVE